MRIRLLFSALIILILGKVCPAQKDDYAIKLQNVQILPPENFTELKEKNAAIVLPGFKNRHFAYLQFFRQINRRERIEIEKKGCRLLNYLPEKTFMVSFPSDFEFKNLSSFPVRSIIAIPDSVKISHLFRLNPISEINNEIQIRIFPGINVPDAIKELSKTGYNFSFHKQQPDIIHAQVFDSEMLIQISHLAFVRRIEPGSVQHIPDDIKGRSLHRSNTINNTVGVSQFNGEGVTVAVADDGSISHIDFKGRFTDLTEQGQGGSHGDMTSGICLGAGNLDPLIPGMAEGAHLVLFDISGSSLGSYPQIVNAVSNFQTYGVIITSTSYSQGCNAYNNSTQEGDQLVHENPEFLFCFSAGNNNGNDCGYGAGGQWGNITGGYKQGKNVIACANVDASGIIDATSSHGPAPDGRLKPDISANGKNQLSTDENNTYQTGGGTSAASPGVAGCAAQLYQAYKQMNNGNNPESALIKGIIMNTADDLGNRGPDYIYGWGQINLRRSFKALSNHNYLSDSVDQGGLRTHVLNVLPGTKRVKIMLYWNDVEGDPSASKALVNDLNLSVVNAGNTFLPLINNPDPNASTLGLPAQPGIDNLNNVEQVSIFNPPTGTLSILINGFDVPLGPQKYYLTWEAETDSIVLTYPSGGEGFVPGETELIRWDATEDSTAFTLEFSQDNGQSYTVVNSNISANLRQYNFTVPQITASKCLLRISRNGYNSVNNRPFTIIKVPSNISIPFACPDSVKLQWQSVNGAAWYEVSRLGNYYMDSIMVSADTSVIIQNINTTLEDWYSVRAVMQDSCKGRRAIAIRKNAGTFNCQLQTDFSVRNLLNPESGTYRNCSQNSSIPVSVMLFNPSLVPVSNCTLFLSVNGSITTANFAGPLLAGDSILYIFSNTLNLSQSGFYQLKIWSSLTGDQNPFNDTVLTNIEVIDEATTQIPWSEDFEFGFVPSGFNLVASGNTVTWDLAQNITGADGNTTDAARFANFSLNAPGAEDALETRMIDLTTAVNNAVLSFDVAYTVRNAQFVEGLRLEASTDCGLNWAYAGYYKTGPYLSTTGTLISTSWEPQDPSDWRRENVIISNYIGQKVLFRFVNKNGFGNNLYIDNINIDHNVDLSNINDNNVQSLIYLYPNPTVGVFNLSGNVTDFSDYSIELYNLTGDKLNPDNVAKEGQNVLINIASFKAGLYMLKLKKGNNFSYFKLIKQ